MINLLPAGGLCNRLQCIECAYRLCRESKERLNVFWVLVDDAMREMYSEMFMPFPDNVQLIERCKYSGWVRSLFSWKNPMRFKPEEADQLIKRCLSGRTNFLTAYYNCESFYAPNDGGYDYSWLRPKTSIRQKIDEIFNMLDGASIGVHIRRTDNQWSIEHSSNEAFFKKLDCEIGENPDVKFYLASDDAQVKQDFKSRYKDKVKTRPVLARHQAGSVADAVVDLFLLARMNKIYGSFRSSFSSVASRIYGIPLEVVSE